MLKNSQLEIIIFILFSIIVLRSFYLAFIQVITYEQPPGDDEDHYHDADIDLINQGKPFYYEW